MKYNCEECSDTGWVGDNGPGIDGNSEYTPCDACDRGKDRKNQAREIRVDTPLQRFTDAMHEAAREDDAVWEDNTLAQVWTLLKSAVEDLEGAINDEMELDTIIDHAVDLALIAAKIAGRAW